MKRRLKKQSRAGGLPPGTPIFIGDSERVSSIFHVMDYDSRVFSERDIQGVDECLPFRDSSSITWINIDGLTDVPRLERLGPIFGIHPLTIEDMLNTAQRPKTEDFGTYVYIILKMLRILDGNLDIEQVSIILGRNFVITVQEKPGDVFDPIRRRIRENSGRVRAMGPDYLACVLMDSIVDNYFSVLEHYDQKIETLEDDILSDTDRNLIGLLHNLKRELLFIKKSIWPSREALSSLIRSDSNLLNNKITAYLRDVQDHIIQSIDTVETLREVVTSLHDLCLSIISNRMNEVMKVLTIIATIFIPLTFIAGVYGMNFNFMPELHWRWSYPLIWFFMISVAVLMLLWFKRKKWL
ncbi:MAG TPA: magnesium/cobalt transporter CorA [Candidatus Sumerlaeota bacterium]|nr:magnesium/cobalt transporter CorA [Candidatus Sumerlaeota bacterium]